MSGDRCRSRQGRARPGPRPDGRSVDREESDSRAARPSRDHPASLRRDPPGELDQHSEGGAVYERDAAEVNGQRSRQVRHPSGGSQARRSSTSVSQMGRPADRLADGDRHADGSPVPVGGPGRPTTSPWTHDSAVRRRREVAVPLAPSFTPASGPPDVATRLALTEALRRMRPDGVDDDPGLAAGGRVRGPEAGTESNQP